MRLQKSRRPETPFTREMRQLTSFLECFKEKEVILQDSPSLSHVNQIFLEAEFHPESQYYSTQESNGREIHSRNTNQGKVSNQKAFAGNNVHNMKKDPYSIYNLLNKPSDVNTPENQQEYEYSDTERVASQKVSNLWRESHMESTKAQKANSNKQKMHNLDALFDKKDGHSMNYKQNQFLGNFQNYTEDQEEKEGANAQRQNNVFVNSNHVQTQPLEDQTDFKRHIAQTEEDYSIHIKPAESFYEVESGRR